MLADLGLYAGALDGVLGPAADDAVRRWQSSLGLPATGEVAFGDVIFVPELPGPLTLRSDIVKRGARLGGGEEVVLALGPAPVFTLPAGDSQSAQIATGARVDITSPTGGSWAAVVAGRAPAASGSTEVLALAAPAAPAAAPAAPAPSAAASAAPSASAPAAPSASASASATPPSAAQPSAAPLCGTECDTIPVTGQTLLPASIVTVETVRGAVVPTIALQTDARQHLALVDVEGTEHPVAVEAEARGMSVVSGVDPGLVVRIPDVTATLDGAAGPG